MTPARTPAVPTGEALRLTGMRIIDGTGAAPVEEGEIVVEDGVLTYVGTRRPAQPDGVRTVDLSGNTVTPGFFDMHVHVAGGIEESPAAMAARFPEEQSLATAKNLRRTLMAGVTTIRDLGGLTPGFRNAVETGDLVGPRAHLAITPLSPTGGHVDFHLPNGRSANVGMDAADSAGIVDTDDEMRVTVRKLIRTGADAIKVCTTGGVSSPSDTPHDIGVPAAQVAIAVEEAAKHQGQPVAAHAQGRRGILEALRGGVSSIEHGYEIDDEAIELMLESGAFLVPTLSSALRVPDPAVVPDFLYKKKVVWSQIAREHVARALQAGVRVALGTDSGVCPHGQNLTELGYMVELGMTPMQAIEAGTLNAAKLSRLDEHLGSLEVGKLADLVVTDVDPLRDVDLLGDPEHVRVVVQGGRVLKDLDSKFGIVGDESLLSVAGAPA